jgi:hypothetical protein
MFHVVPLLNKTLGGGGVGRMLHVNDIVHTASLTLQVG